MTTDRLSSASHQAVSTDGTAAPRELDAWPTPAESETVQPRSRIARASSASSAPGSNGLRVDG